MAATGCAAIACASGALAAETGAPAQYDAIIAKHSRANGVPEALIRRVIVRESKYNPRAMHSGHYGMMQIKPATARAMGYRGSAAGLLDADVNLTYGVRYLAGAYKVAAGDHDRSVRYYASGYYYDAKRKGMLAQIGMGRNGALTAPPSAVAEAPSPATVATAAVPAETRLAPAPAQTIAALVPTPPVRGPVTPMAPTATAAVAPVLAAAVPVPQPRGPLAASTIQTAAAQPAAPLPPVRPAEPRVVAPAAPVLASAAPLAQARDAGPQTTGSIPSATSAVAAVEKPSVPLPPRREAMAVASAVPAPAQPAARRTISPTAAPALASAGPVSPVLSYAEPARPVAAAPRIPAPRSAPTRP
ncbi:MAG: lytic transglycosylase [Ancylobacter novellus]|uniref:Lytic transglycosylase n=1 Tax=Ancylobacter novellus TaxID=921 RepID=A0A2W5KK41_ANCNO|nr:MAG: lytic transglycosylase [Ancylobacter novellus]